MHNARLTERTSFLGQVDVVPHASNRVLRVWAQDVSETGMFLQTTQPFALGETVSLRFDVESNEVHVRAAEVMWIRKFEPINVDGKLPGIGLRFVSVDPPARAALRRLMPKEPRDTIVDQAATSGGALNTLPPVSANGLPAPKITLPPLTASIIARASGTQPRRPAPRNVTMRPQKAQPGVSQIGISLLPFDQMPVISLPPDEPNLSSEARVFAGVPAGPRDISMEPTGAKKNPRITQPMFPELEIEESEGGSVDDNGAFAGWTFRVTSPMPEAPIEVPAGMNVRFDDEAPRSITPRFHGGSSVIDNPSVLESSTAPPRDGADDGNGEQSGDFSLGSLPPAFHAGELAVSNLSLVQERAAAPEEPRFHKAQVHPRSRGTQRSRRSVGTAVAFLVAGCAAGAVVGIAPGRWLTPATAVVATTFEPRAEPAPKVVAAVVSAAEAEGDLLRPVAAAPAAVVAVPELVALAEPEAKAVAQKTESAPKLTAAEEREARREARKAAREAAREATREAAREKQLATEAKAKKVRATEAARQEPVLASTRKLAKPEPLFASPGHLEVALPAGGTVKRAFALANPSRVVVDLSGARLPQKPIDVDEGGVVQLRFGHPDEKTDRVVIIIAGGGDKPAMPAAFLDGDRLTVSWSW